MLFLEGLLSFLSPCFLPLLPVYVVYFAGEASSSRRSLTIFVRALAFVLGFSLVFVALGVFAGSLGQALAAHRQLVNLVSGALIIVFGLSFLGVIRLPLKGFTTARKITGTASAVLFGMIFAVGLTPCVGAFLGAALMTAASEGGALKGALLLAEYSLGLGVPLVVSALLINRLAKFLTFFKVHAGAVSVFSGVLLIGIGAITLFTGCLRGPMGNLSKGVDETPKLAQNTRSGEVKVMEITLTQSNFEQEVLLAKQTVVVDFWAPWCGPCRMLAPELEALAKAHPEIKVGKVNVDDNPELCAKYGIMSIPAIMVFKNGKLVKQAVGYRPQSDLAELLK